MVLELFNVNCQFGHTGRLVFQLVSQCRTLQCCVTKLSAHGCTWSACVLILSCSVMKCRVSQLEFLNVPGFPWVNGGRNIPDLLTVAQLAHCMMLIAVPARLGQSQALSSFPRLNPSELQFTTQDTQSIFFHHSAVNYQCRLVQHRQPHPQLPL